MTIRPTSGDAVRAFSDAGAVVTKFRTQLNDNTIGKFRFLRSYFKHDPNLKI
jgi:ribosomal protein L35AE/L33A